MTCIKKYRQVKECSISIWQLRDIFKQEQLSEFSLTKFEGKRKEIKLQQFDQT